MMKSRKICLLLWLLSFSFTAFAQNFVCPDVRSINRVSGQFAWITSEPAWEGFFAAPNYGRGKSSTIKHFKEARWLQLSNLNDSTGILECDYVGNYNDEIIRFVLSLNQTTPKPTSQNWMCEFNPDFPGVQCRCTGEATLCWVKPS